MTDKQIIIDGVDVSGCEWFYKNDPCKNTCKYFCTPCEWVEIQKCMYKYAKRKEQECEELAYENYELNELFDRLKAENDELKDLNTRLDNQRETYWKGYQKLKQTLTEIKEIAEKCCINQATLDCENYDDCTQCGRISDGEGIQQILQKISEVFE